MNPVHAIIEAAKLPEFGLQNPFLELASLTLESRKAGLDYMALKETFERIKEERRIGVGLFRRATKGHGWHEMSLSHDELIGISILSNLLDDGETIQEIIDQGLFFGLYLNGNSAKFVDSEWFTYWRPEYRAIMKLGAGRKISWIEDQALQMNLIYATAWNVKRIRLLFLEGLGYNAVILKKVSDKLGDKYRERYGKNQLYWNLWEIQ